MPKPLNLDAELQGQDETDKFVSDGSYTIEDDIVNQIFAEDDEEDVVEEPEFDTGIDDLDFDDDEE